MTETIGFPRAGTSFESALLRFSHPIDVLRDCTLERDAKRAILSAWASDAWAIPSIPSLRRPPGFTHPVAIDAILDALSRLDEPPDPRPGGAAARPARRARAQWTLRRRRGRLTRRYLERHVFKPPGETAAAARGI